MCSYMIRVMKLELVVDSISKNSAVVENSDMTQRIKLRFSSALSRLTLG
jgi:hypothetical protein